MLAVKKELKEEFVKQNLGKTLSFIAEEVEDGYTVGYTENYLRVYLKGELEMKKYKIVPVKPYGDGAIAKIVEE